MNGAIKYAYVFLGFDGKPLGLICGYGVPLIRSKYNMSRWNRRDEKKKNAWYKKYMANNRKSLEVIIQAQRDRLARLVKGGKD